MDQQAVEVRVVHEVLLTLRINIMSIMFMDEEGVEAAPPHNQDRMPIIASRLEVTQAQRETLVRFMSRRLRLSMLKEKCYRSKHITLRSTR